MRRRKVVFSRMTPDSSLTLLNEISTPITHLLLGNVHREFAGRINLSSSLFFIILVLHEYQIDFINLLKNGSSLNKFA